MNYQKNRFLSSDERTQITYHLFLPEQAPLAVLQICHDVSEHLLRYRDLAEYLCSFGIAVCGCDHKGHGESLDRSGILGVFDGGGALRDLCEDQKILYDLMRKKYRHLPYLFLGQGMGELILRLFVGRYKQTADGLILMSCMGPDLPVRKWALWVTIQSLLSKKDAPCQKLKDRMFSKNAEGSKALSRDEQAVRGYDEDPLCGFALCPRAYGQLVDALKQANGENAPDIELSLPVMICAGSDDPLSPDALSARSLHESFSMAELCSLSLKIYQGARHDLIHETNKQEVFSDLKDFILRVAEGVQAARVGSYF